MILCEVHIIHFNPAHLPSPSYLHFTFATTSPSKENNKFKLETFQLPLPSSSFPVTCNRCLLPFFRTCRKYGHYEGCLPSSSLLLAVLKPASAKAQQTPPPPALKAHTHSQGSDSSLLPASTTPGQTTPALVIKASWTVDFISVNDQAGP